MVLLHMCGKLGQSEGSVTHRALLHFWFRLFLGGLGWGWLGLFADVAVLQITVRNQLLNTPEHISAHWTPFRCRLWRPSHS